MDHSRRNCCCHKKQTVCRGFTLVETMVAIAIAGVLLSIALPSFRDMIIAQKVRGTASDLYVALISARSEAMKRNAQVSVIRAAGGWGSGWTVEWSGTVIQTQVVDINDVTIAGPTAASVIYSWTGRPLAASAGASFTIYATNVPARCISLTLSGMPEIQTDTDGDPTNGC